MNNPPIRFCGFDFPYNPESIQINKQLLYYEIPQIFENGTVLKNGVMARTIKGKGNFIGRNCIDKYNELMQFFILNESGVLSINQINPILAKFVKLNLCLLPAPNCIEYEFEFVEDVSGYTQIEDVDKIHIVRYGENLWSIASLYNTSVNKLLKLNPQIKRANDIKAFERLIVV